MRWGRSVLASGVCLVAFATASAQTTTVAQQISNNTSACSSSNDPTGNRPYCFNSFDGLDTNGNNAGSETFVPDSPAGHVSSVSIRQLMYPGWNGRVICEYQPWFGTSNHKSVGYNQNNAATVTAQDSFMLAVGCDINLIDFYGSLDPSQAFNLATTNTVFSDLSTRSGFPLKFGIMEDKNALTYSCSTSSTNESATIACVQSALIADMDYVNAHYANSGAYFSDAGDPVVFSFVTSSTWPVLTPADWDTIWSGVKAHSDAYAAPFKYIHEFGAFTSATWDNGRYAWMQPPKYSSSQQFWWGSVTNLLPTYLDTFYSAAIANPSQITVAGLWKGFDDNNASWSGNRVIAEQCGQVWLNTANEIAKYFGGTNPQLPYVQIATWNDYEEGTEVESGIDNCYAVNASISGAQLSWSLATSDLHATPATVHHFNIYYADAGGYLYTAASNLSVTTNSLNLSSMVPPGSWTVYVEMVGQPLIINRMSSGLAFQNGASVGQLSTAAFDFGNQTVGTSSSGQKITLKNSGPASMRIYAINVTGDFAQINNCPGLLTSGTSCTVTVTFSPSVNGNRTGSLQVSDSAGSAPQGTSLNGTGIVPVVSFSPASISFAAQPLTSTSTAQVATLSNAGPGVLIINSVAASGDFSLSNNSCTGAIAVGASCSFSVQFAPSLTGARTGFVVLSSNALGTNALSVGGMGADFALNGTPNTASVSAGGLATYTISVPSSGASFSNTINLSCTGLPANTACAFTPPSLNADSTSILTIKTRAAHEAAWELGNATTRSQYALWLWSNSLGFLGCAFVAGFPKQRNMGARIKRGARCFILGLLLLLLFACGGGSVAGANNLIPGTPAGTYTITVTGSSGTLARTAILSLTVD